MSGYWEKRAMADEQRAHRAASEVNADIKRLYQRQYRKIYASMERLYGQADWGEAHRITRTQLWQYSHWKAMEQDLRQFAADTPKIEIEKLTGTLNGVFKDTIGADVSRFSGQEGVTFRVSTDPMTVVNTAWSGEAYSSRIWKNTSAIAERIQSDMEDMMVSGRSLKDIKKQLMQDFSIGYNEAARLVDTEAAYVMNSAAKQRYKADGITKIRWLTGMEDGKECEICKSRANKVWHIDTAPPMPAHPRCRCCWAGVVELPGEYVPCDGEGESAQEAQTVKEPRTVKEAKAPEETTAFGFVRVKIAEQLNKKIGYAMNNNIARAGKVEANGLFVNNSEILFANAKNVQPIEGYEDFTCHADANGFYIDMNGKGDEGDFFQLSPSEYAKAIRNSPTYRGGNVRILSCQSGAKKDGAAQQLADALGVDVCAPTEIVNIDENGEIFLSDNDILADIWYNASDRSKVKETGKWVVFHPRKE